MAWEITMENNIDVYVSALHTSLHEKWELMQNLLKLTQEQEQILSKGEMEPDDFDALIQKKSVLLDRMGELDKGFQNLFDRIGTSLKEKKQQYKEQIQEMQELIRKITSCGVKLEALEKKNKNAFQTFTAQKHKEIHDFRVSNRTAVSYYKNMANQHQEGQSYFLDKKK
ncbi:MAG TPA: hypothetical protein DDY31_02645 [Lachnospiraceae bacterium]|nr:hypothetical protein [Lachnospiraceae bacterium]